MAVLQIDAIRHVAATPLVFKRGEALHKRGLYRCIARESDNGLYSYEVEGSYGTYEVRISLNGTIVADCNCPYPEQGCKHVVAILLKLFDEQQGELPETIEVDSGVRDYLSPEEIRTQALEDRAKRARIQDFSVQQGDMFKGDHLVITGTGNQYQVTLHDPVEAVGHCSCPDFQTNRLATCKHIIFLSNYFKEQKSFSGCIGKERFPYVDIFWDNVAAKPRLFQERTLNELEDGLAALLKRIFDRNNLFNSNKLIDFIAYLDQLESYKQVRIQEAVLQQLADSCAGRRA